MVDSLIAKAAQIKIASQEEMALKRILEGERLRALGARSLCLFPVERTATFISCGLTHH
jgi:hypothetical protein